MQKDTGNASLSHKLSQVLFSYWEKLQHIRLGEQRMSLQNHFSQLNHLALEMVKG